MCQIMMIIMIMMMMIDDDDGDDHHNDDIDADAFPLLFGFLYLLYNFKNLLEISNLFNNS